MTPGWLKKGSCRWKLGYNQKLHDCLDKRFFLTFSSIQHCRGGRGAVEWSELKVK